MIIQEHHYYPYGGLIAGLGKQGSHKYLYSGKELVGKDLGLNWYDHGARYYDSQLGRWFVQDPAYQFASPYVGMGNNPVMMYDPDGRFAFLPVLIGMGVGALIGAGTAAATYSVGALINGHWDWGSFGRSVAMGAVGGAISGGIGAGFAGSAFAQTTAFSILNNTTSTLLGNTILGNDITWGTVAGSVAGGFIGSKIPQFSGVKGGVLKNIGAEIGYGALRGGALGAIGGGVAAGIDGKNIGEGILQGAYAGAIGGAASASLNILTMGAAYVPENREKYGDFGKYKPIYRRGTFITHAFFEGGGVAIGRNLVTNTYKENKWGNLVTDYNEYLRAHETGHYVQQVKMGWANFYGRTLAEYITYGSSNTYGRPGTLEWGADMYSNLRLGYYYDSNYFAKRTFLFNLFP